MKIFDESGNFLGEFIEDSKDKISDSFDDSVGIGFATLLYMILLIILVVVAWFILKGIYMMCKLFLRTMWWFVRIPFFLILKKEWPQF